MRLRAVPIELTEANEYIARHHRHHKPVVGHRFSIGCIDPDGVLRGVAVAGRPVARMTDQRRVLEVTRLCTDGCPNACSFLYSRAARIAQEMGFEIIQTFILSSEQGVSLRAAGWAYDGDSPGGQWKHTDGYARRMDQPTCPKGRWRRVVNEPREVVLWSPLFDDVDNAKTPAKQGENEHFQPRLA